MNKDSDNHHHDQDNSNPPVKIGLEIHGYLSLENNRKLFCDCSLDPDAAPNSTICPVCTGQPGSKPFAPNSEAIEKIIAIGLLFGASINQEMLFQRKHYSWPDLPAGYQKTMSGSYGKPSAEHGSFFGIRIRELHLEEDPARWDPDTGTVDYNRSGYPLMELVSEPDFKSAAEVETWLKTFIAALSYIRALNPALGIKCDVNISIGPEFIRTELKNMNALKNIKDAIAYEIYRQQREPAMLQTRTYDPITKKTVFMRPKEEAADYQYIPEPDLLPITILPATIESIRSRLPESPETKYHRYLTQGVDETDASVIARNLDVAGLFDAVTMSVPAPFAAKWFRRDITAAAESPALLLHLVEYRDELEKLFRLVHKKEITDITFKELLEKLSEEFVDVEQYVKDKQLLRLGHDDEQVQGIIAGAIASSPDAVNDFFQGKEKALNLIVGKVMQRTQGKAQPEHVKESILKMLHTIKQESG